MPTLRADGDVDETRHTKLFLASNAMCSPSISLDTLFETLSETPTTVQSQIQSLPLQRGKTSYERWVNTPSGAVLRLQIAQRRWSRTFDRKSRRSARGPSTLAITSNCSEGEIQRSE